MKSKNSLKLGAEASYKCGIPSRFKGGNLDKSFQSVLDDLPSLERRLGGVYVTQDRIELERAPREDWLYDDLRQSAKDSDERKSPGPIMDLGDVHVNSVSQVLAAYMTLVKVRRKRYNNSSERRRSYQMLSKILQSFECRKSKKGRLIFSRDKIGNIEQLTFLLDNYGAFVRSATSQLLSNVQEDFNFDAAYHSAIAGILKRLCSDKKKSTHKTEVSLLQPYKSRLGRQTLTGESIATPAPRLVVEPSYLDLSVNDMDLSQSPQSSISAVYWQPEDNACAANYEKKKKSIVIERRKMAKSQAGEYRYGSRPLEGVLDPFQKVENQTTNLCQCGLVNQDTLLRDDAYADEVNLVDCALAAPYHSLHPTAIPTDISDFVITARARIEGLMDRLMANPEGLMEAFAENGFLRYNNAEIAEELRNSLETRQWTKHMINVLTLIGMLGNQITMISWHSVTSCNPIPWGGNIPLVYISNSLKHMMAVSSTGIHPRVTLEQMLKAQQEADSSEDFRAEMSKMFRTLFTRVFLPSAKDPAVQFGTQNVGITTENKLVQIIQDATEYTTRVMPIHILNVMANWEETIAAFIVASARSAATICQPTIASLGLNHPVLPSHFPRHWKNLNLDAYSMPYHQIGFLIMLVHACWNYSDILGIILQFYLREDFSMYLSEAKIRVAITVHNFNQAVLSERYYLLVLLGLYFLKHGYHVLRCFMSRLLAPRLDDFIKYLDLTKSPRYSSLRRYAASIALVGYVLQVLTRLGSLLLAIRLLYLTVDGTIRVAFQEVILDLTYNVGIVPNRGWRPPFHVFQSFSNVILQYWRMSPVFTIYQVLSHVDIWVLDPRLRERYFQTSVTYNEDSLISWLVLKLAYTPGVFSRALMNIWTPVKQLSENFYLKNFQEGLLFYGAELWKLLLSWRSVTSTTIGVVQEMFYS